MSKVGRAQTAKTTVGGSKYEGQKRVGIKAIRDEYPNRTCYKYRYKMLKMISQQLLLIAGFQVLSCMVPGEGVEPSHPFGRQILSLLRLPFRHPGKDGAGEGNRTLVTSLEGWGSAIELRPRKSRG